jgi:hypothetical protein
MSLLGANRLELKNKQEQGTDNLRAFINKTVVSNDYGGIDRLIRYQLYWHFYKGKHWRDFNETFISFNYVRAFINKVNQFLLGKDSFSLQVKGYETEIVDEELEQTVEQLLLSVWRKNKKVVLSYNMLQMGSVTGDLWMHVQWSVEIGMPKISVLDSRHCFPEFKYGNIEELESFTLRQPLEANVQNYRVFVTRYTVDSIETWFQEDTAYKDPKRMEYTKQKNTYGFIPIVHVQNRPSSDGYYGESDATDILKLNKVYNELAQELKGIIDYYVEPTTVITGGTAKSLKKGLGNIWSGLPAEANVFNLGLDADLSAATTFMGTLKTAMHELSDVPENALGKLQAISNTSAAALQLTFQPLIQQADMKWLTYGQGITDVNDMILRMFRLFAPAVLAKIPDTFSELYRVDPVFTYGFPQDRMNDLQQAQIELQLRLATRKQIMERIGVNNVNKVLSEIDDDIVRMQELDARGVQLTMPQNPEESFTQNPTQQPQLSNNGRQALPENV